MTRPSNMYYWKPGQGVNPLDTDPKHIMFGPGAGVSSIVERDSKKPVPKDEPVLLLRASDPAAIPALCAYLEHCTDKREKEKIRRHLERVRGYRAHHRIA